MTNSALFQASYWGHIDVVKTLLSANADVFYDFKYHLTVFSATRKDEIKTCIKEHMNWEDLKDDEVNQLIVDEIKNRRWNRRKDFIMFLYFFNIIQLNLGSKQQVFQNLYREIAYYL